MSLLSLIGISTAMAETATTVAAKQPSLTEGLTSFLPITIAMIALFYFLLIRPQSKRAKEHRSMLNQLSVGDEIVTTGGIVGRLKKMADKFMVISISKDVDITMEKASIAKVLPKGTLEAMES